MIVEAGAEPEEDVVHPEVEDAAVVRREVVEVEEPKEVRGPSSYVTDEILRLVLDPEY